MLSEKQNVSVDRVSKLAGYNRCTFYRYYTDIEELQAEVEKEVADRIYNIVCENGDSLDLELFANSIAAFYEKEGEFIFELIDRYPSFRQTMKEKMAPLIRERFHIDESCSENLAISFISTAITHTILDWYRSGKKESVYEMSKFIVNTLQNGVLK